MIKLKLSDKLILAVAKVSNLNFNFDFKINDVQYEEDWITPVSLNMVTCINLRVTEFPISLEGVDLDTTTFPEKIEDLVDLYLGNWKNGDYWFKINVPLTKLDLKEYDERNQEFISIANFLADKYGNTFENLMCSKVELEERWMEEVQEFVDFNFPND